MEWAGSFGGTKGYKTYKLESSNPIAGFMPAARFWKDGRFSITYRTNCEKPDRKELSNALRGILGYKGKYLTIIDYAAGAATIEFYCLLEGIPTVETMERIEGFLSSL